MGRRKNNPELVQELIDRKWTMPQDEFEEKYYSLSSSDRWKVGEALDKMDEEFMSDDFEELLEEQQYYERMYLKKKVSRR